VGLESGVAAIAVGSDHTCVVTFAGETLCWGHNGFGQLGFAGPWKEEPTLVSDVPLALGVSAGMFSTCVVTVANEVFCWGTTHDGQVGDEDPEGQCVPRKVSGLESGAIAVSVGTDHTCALTTEGGVKCWGRNEFGALGDGSKSNSIMPRQVLGLESGVVAVSAGAYHTCAVTVKGEAKCWGGNSAGQVGSGTVGDSWQPELVWGLDEGVVSVSAGGGHSCAVTEDGRLWCWGTSFYGALGNGELGGWFTPVPVVGF